MHFSWDAFPLNCPAIHIHYDILAFNCGSCPNISNYTNVTCRSTNEPIIDDSNCVFFVRSAFSLQSAMCYNQWQNKSLKIQRCPGAQCSNCYYVLKLLIIISLGENGLKNLLAVIPPLAMLLLLLAVLVPLSLHIVKKKLLAGFSKRYYNSKFCIVNAYSTKKLYYRSCQKASHRNNQHKEV